MLGTQVRSVKENSSQSCPVLWVPLMGLCWSFRFQILLFRTNCYMTLVQYFLKTNALWYGNCFSTASPPWILSLSLSLSLSQASLLNLLVTFNSGQNRMGESERGCRFPLLLNCSLLRWQHSAACSILHFSQLMENRISTIERGAFQDLKELERL
jgi:hypothetical protein